MKQDIIWLDDMLFHTYESKFPYLQSECSKINIELVLCGEAEAIGGKRAARCLQAFKDALDKSYSERKRPAGLIIDVMIGHNLGIFAPDPTAKDKFKKVETGIGADTGYVLTTFILKNLRASAGYVSPYDSFFCEVPILFFSVSPFPSGSIYTQPLESQTRVFGENNQAKCIALEKTGREEDLSKILSWARGVAPSS